MRYTYKKTIAIFFTSLLILSTGCENYLDINANPDLLSPEQIPMSSELPAAITGIGASAGSYYAIVGGFWSQFWTQSAVANQYVTIDDYSITSATSFINGAWNSMYDALTDVRNIKAKALKDSVYSYYLIATTLEVYASQILVDMFGSIPYKEANNPSILNPKFESADQVYDQMVTDLKDALAKDLKKSSAGNAPSNTDFIFQGNMTSWTQFANTLLLKLYLRQSEVRPSVSESGIKELLDANTTFLARDAAITQFKDEQDKSNPLYETDRRRLNVGTNLRASQTLGSFLQTNSDPRLAQYYNGTTFQIQGNYAKGSGTASVVKLSATSPFYFMSLAESKFLQAEADVRYGGGARAKSLYDEGVTAAFARWKDGDGNSLNAASFINASGSYAYPTGTEEEKIKAIITQKWIALFPENGFESFIEQNRTGYPEISKVAQSSPSYVSGQLAYSVEGKTGGEFPRRLPYPQQELQRNTNAPKEIIGITVRVWYDVN